VGSNELGVEGGCQDGGKGGKKSGIDSICRVKSLNEGRGKRFWYALEGGMISKNFGGGGRKRRAPDGFN